LPPFPVLDFGGAVPNRQLIFEDFMPEPRDLAQLYDGIHSPIQTQMLLRCVKNAHTVPSLQVLDLALVCLS